MFVLMMTTGSPALPGAVVEEPQPLELEALPSETTEQSGQLQDPFHHREVEAGVESSSVTSTVVLESSPTPSAEREHKFIGGYWGLGWRFGGASRQLGYFLVVRGGALLGKRFSIGGELVQLRKRFGEPIASTDGETYVFNLAYGGVQVGFAPVSRRRLRVDLRTTFGGGVGCIGDRQYKNVRKYQCYESQSVFVVDPSLSVTIKLAPWVRIGGEAGYRLVGRQRDALGGPEPFRLSGGYGGLSLDFGWFGPT